MHRLARQIRIILIGIRECEIKANRISYRCADKAALKALDEAPGADGQVLVVRGTAVEGLSVHGTDIVDIDGIPVLNLGLSLSHLVACVGAQRVIDVEVDEFVADFFSRHLDLYGIIRGQIHIVGSLDPTQIGLVRSASGEHCGCCDKRSGAGKNSLLHGAVQSFPSLEFCRMKACPLKEAPITGIFIV